MVVSAAGTDCVLLQQSPAGRRLARVEHARATGGGGFGGGQGIHNRLAIASRSQCRLSRVRLPVRIRTSDLTPLAPADSLFRNPLPVPNVTVVRMSNPADVPTSSEGLEKRLGL